VCLSRASEAYSNTIWATCTSGNQARTCDSTAWYPGALTLVWHASPTPDGTSGCGLEINYRYNSDQITPVVCSATWPGPGSGTTTVTQPYTLHVETSSPVATVAPSRPPDSGGWYNHSVSGIPSATSFSGIASCASSTYSGPSTLSATVSGTCIDNAGKTVTFASAPFAYDTTSPSLAVGAAPGDRSVVLSWQTRGDIAPTASVSVTRSRTGGHAASAHTVYSGTATSFRDTHVRNGVRYQYTITAVDQAGNASVQSFTVIPGPRLLTPAANARLNAPPLLSWTPVIGARYYNVQLYRGRHKLLSEWPKHATLQLRRTWRFDGHRYHLRPGRYRWYVWPGFGRRSAADYGRPVGSGTFVIVP
jgi:hypothetical protein